MGGFYMQYLESLCRRRGWQDPMYECYRNTDGYTCLVFVNGREYQTDSSCESDDLAQENAAMRAFMVCRNFSVNGGMLARNGIVQGLPADEFKRKHRKGRRSHRHGSSRSGAGSSSVPDDSTSGYASLAPSDVFDRGDSVSITSCSTLPSRPAPSSTRLEQIISKARGLLTRATKIKPPPSDPESKSYTALDLEEALAAQDYEKTHWLLENWFQQVAVDDFAWIVELKQLGYSPLEITDELLEKAIHGAWILEPFTPPSAKPFFPEFHQDHCAHRLSQKAPLTHNVQTQILPVEDDLNPPALTAKESIEYFCGLGGVRPCYDGSFEIELGSVDFEEDCAKATVTLTTPADHSTTLEVLKNLESAARYLQDIGACCESFTLIYAHEQRAILHRVPFSLITSLRQHLEQTAVENVNEHPGILKDTIDDLSGSDTFMHVLLTRVLSTAMTTTVASLLTQFLSLALLSYAQAHCGSIRPFYLDTPLETVILRGSDGTDANPDICAIGSLVELTCLGEMIGASVFTLRFGKLTDDGVIPVLPDQRFDLVASIEDVLDTWGPGEVGQSDYEGDDDPSLLYSVPIGGGHVCVAESNDSGIMSLHWSQGPSLNNQPQTAKRSFDRKTKYTIGTSVTENQRCQGNPQAQLINAAIMLEELHTFPSHWEVAERQLGIGFQTGQAISPALQFNQTWIKMAGATKKSAIMSQHAIYTADLDSFFAVQVSVSTGIARRVRLRDMLADLLPAYISGLITKPPLWQALKDDFGILSALRNHDLKQWLEKLDHPLQLAFENLVFAILSLLRDTGIDRKAQNFVIACIQPNLPFNCFKVPCKSENCWARMLADSEDTATFAYITTQCLETSHIKCTGPSAAWTNSTAMLWTAVSCYEERMALSKTSAAAGSDHWGLRHSEAYLIGRPDASLFVQVDRPDDAAEARLLVSVSTIPPKYLYRFYRKGKPKRLRERKLIDHCAENVVVLVRQSNSSGG